MIYIFIGPSASGKTTIAKSCGLTELISHTTRSPREGEQEGKDYYFITKKEFAEKYNNGDFIEYTSYAGNQYALSKEEVESKKHEDVFVIMDKEGIQQMKKLYKDEIKIIYVIAPRLTIIWRLLKRNGLFITVQRTINAWLTGEFKNRNLADLTLHGKKGYLEKNISRFKLFRICN